jgi:hypothetical protein
MGTPAMNKHAHFTCNNPRRSVMISAPLAMADHSISITKKMTGYSKQLKADLESYKGQEYRPKLDGSFSIASRIISGPVQERRDALGMYFRMALQAMAWKTWYMEQYFNKAPLNASLNAYFLGQIALWNSRWERSRELTICCMFSVTLLEFALVPSAISTGSSKRERAPSDVEDD